MAQTLKFGKGTWATKKGSTLSYNDESNNYKPLPFTTTRSSSATRVNKEGLIEVVENDRPRIDYTDSSNGVLLLEPARTNLIAYSEDFSQSYWSKVRSTISSNQIISPDGTLNADLLTATDTSENYCQQNVSSTVSGSKQTASFFVKKGTSDFCHILLWDVSNDGARQWFDLNNGIEGSSTSFGSSISVDSSQMINYGNGWYKCIVVFNNSNTTVRFRISASNSNGDVSSSVGKTIYIYGAQVETGSYASSYIPTSGSAVTRVADTASGAGNSEVFNDSQGVLFANIAALADDGTNRYISISDGSNNNRVQIIYSSDSNKITGGVVSGNSGQCAFYIENIDTTLNRKLALKYKQNDFSLWSNGFEIGTDTSGIAPTALDTLEFRRGNGTSDFYGKTKEIGYYDTALTDLELEKLTSYVSLSEMATELNYKAL